MLVLPALAGCKEKVVSHWFTAEKAIAYFSKIEEACNRDAGKLWGKNLYGPLMFIERTSRKITANMPDNEGLLKFKDGVYTGTYPAENIINTTSIIYGGTTFGMAPLPTEEDNYRITIRGIHALFHSFQKEKGIDPENFNILIMDEKEARLWMKLEWKALKKAIMSEGEEQTLAIRDALIFRGSNRESYQRYALLENKFEAYEGLATFTYMLVGSDNYKEFKTRLLEYLDRIYGFQSYARSYGAIHGALYACLLYRQGFDFKSISPDTTDLGRLVKMQYQIELPEKCRDVAGSIALHYNINEIYREEDQRLQEIKERLNDRVSNFTERPVVLLELESPSFDFEPEDVSYLDTLGTLYHGLRVSDNWGKLTVTEGDCLVSNNYKFIRITAKGLKQDRNHASGEGWQIILNDGWEVARSEQSFFIRKRMY